MKIKILVISLILSAGILAHGKEKPPAPEPVDNRPAIIDAYFIKRKMPLAGHGKKFVEVADQYGLDWRLLPALSVREQSGGLRLPYNCPGKTKNYNAFGWGSGSNCFTSFDQAIELVGMNLGTHRYYAGKSTYAKLQTYNPPSVVAAYASEVISIMNAISDGKTITE